MYRYYINTKKFSSMIGSQLSVCLLREREVNKSMQEPVYALGFGAESVNWFSVSSGLMVNDLDSC